MSRIQQAADTTALEGAMRQKPYSLRASLRALPMTVTAVIGSLLAGCAVGPDYHPPRADAPSTFQAAEPAVYSGDQPQSRFWEQFGDPMLDRLVGDALLSNHDLRIALGRLAEARAARHESMYDLAPTVTASGGHTTERLPTVQAGFPFTTSYYDAGFDATWELDLFGRVRRGVEARTAELQGAEATLRDAQVSVTAEVARTYFELRGEQNELAVARNHVDNQQETLRFSSAQLDAGRGTELDTSRAQAELSTTRSTIAPLEAAVSRSIHRLGVLTGREPNALTSELSSPASLRPLPELTAVGDPAAMLRRRPDIRVAERQLAADTALVGVAIGDLFPKVTFTGSFGYSAAAPAGLGTGASRAYAIGPGLSWAAFDLGRVHAQVAAARARDDTALAEYEKTVLQALEETENALVTHARTREQLEYATQAARASGTAAQLARIRYEGGAVDFLAVLDAERTHLEAEDQLARTQTDTATSLIAVYKALGGAWEGSPLPRYTRAAGQSQ